MTEETQDSIITGGDETIVHSASQMPGAMDTTLTGSRAIGRLAHGRLKTHTLTLVSREELNQFAGHMRGVMRRFGQRIARSQHSTYLDIGRLATKGQEQAKRLGQLQSR